jgi:radical SAM protein with 4Fe4S-binding SPASM domain
MRLTTAKKLVGISQEAGARHFNIIGGEPTLWPGLFGLNKFCRDRGVSTGLITNAVRFGDDRYWHEYQQHPSDQISISVKSTNKVEFCEVTKSGVYDKTMKGIARAIEFHGCGISTVYNSLVGLDGLRQIAEDCRGLGASKIIVNMCSPVIDGDGVVQRFATEPEQLVEDTVAMYDLLDEIYNGKFEIDIQMPLCLFPQSFVGEMLAKKHLATICQVFNRSGLNFDTVGNLTVCNELFNSVVARMGVDYHDAPSLMEHLNRDELREDYRQLLRFPAEACSDCRWQNRCRGGCLLNWMILDPAICRAVR